jgi:AraC family transcriptional regulator
MFDQTACNLSVVAAQLVEAAWRARDGDGNAAKAHIAHAVALLDGQPSAPPAHQRTIEKVVRQRIARGGLAAWQAQRLAAHVDANLADKIQIEDLARVLNLSASHFCRAFKSTFGVPAHNWVMRRRIEVAQGLMLTTCSTLSEIALNCGMSDQSHFTRCFRRIVGETPYFWRRSRRVAMEVPAAGPVSPLVSIRANEAVAAFSSAA